MRRVDEGIVTAGQSETISCVVLPPLPSITLEQLTGLSTCDALIMATSQLGNLTSVRGMLESKPAIQAAPLHQARDPGRGRRGQQCHQRSVDTGPTPGSDGFDLSYQLWIGIDLTARMV